MHQGPVSQRVTINRTIDINSSSMANRVLREFAINRNPLCNGAQFTSLLPTFVPGPGADSCTPEGIRNRRTKVVLYYFVSPFLFSNFEIYYYTVLTIIKHFTLNVGVMEYLNVSHGLGGYNL